MIPTESAWATASAKYAESRVRDRMAAYETIGCSSLLLRRLDHVWYDEDIRDAITAVRSALSIAQSKLKTRIAEALAERTAE